MNRSLNWLVAALMIFVVYRYLSAEHKASKNQNVVPESAKISSVERTPPKQLSMPDAEKKSFKPTNQLQPKIVAAPPQVPPGMPIKMPKNAVPFHMIKGLMVAYGDVVLGRPLSENVPDNGFAEAPKPEFWNSDIPFLVSPEVENQDAVYKAVEYFNQNTTIHFVPGDENSKDAVVFEPTDENCYSYLGRIGGHQPIYVSKNCTEPEVTHELMHVLGFVHEQSRPDRDNYVNIFWDRIEKDKQDQFYEVPESMVKNIESRPFDYNSIMLYLPTAFAAQPGETTMESKTSSKVDPVRSGLSPEDLARIRKIYPPKN
jgi:hypothetical protein